LKMVRRACAVRAPPFCSASDAFTVPVLAFNSPFSGFLVNNFVDCYISYCDGSALAIISLLLRGFNIHAMKWFALYQLAYFLCFATAAPSRRRTVVKRSVSDKKYDRAITTFDATGRLLQVEYGLNAANNNKRGTTNILAAVDCNDDTIYVAISSSTTRSSEKIHRLDDHLWMVASGLSGDAQFLASQLRNYCQKHVMHFGERPTVLECARHAATMQHLLTYRGGHRPLGCAAIILGMDANGARIVSTDPGGMLEDCLYYAAGKHQEKIMAQMTEQYKENIGGGMESSKVAAALARTIADTMELNDTMDVWIMQKNEKKIAMMDSICLRGLEQSQVDKIPAFLAGVNAAQQDKSI
jgi:20S proteasome alpha/beta subunit